MNKKTLRWILSAICIDLVLFASIFTFCLIDNYQKNSVKQDDVVTQDVYLDLCPGQADSFTVEPKMLIYYQCKVSLYFDEMSEASKYLYVGVFLDDQPVFTSEEQYDGSYNLTNYHPLSEHTKESPLKGRANLSYNKHSFTFVTYLVNEVEEPEIDISFKFTMRMEKGIIV